MPVQPAPRPHEGPVHPFRYNFTHFPRPSFATTASSPAVLPATRAVPGGGETTRSNKKDLLPVPSLPDHTVDRDCGSTAHHHRRRPRFPDNSASDSLVVLEQLKGSQRHQQEHQRRRVGTAVPPKRPVLTSKFSNDNLTSTPTPTRRMAPKTWLQNIASSARSSTFSTSSTSPSSSSCKDPLSLDRHLVIGNPELVSHGGGITPNAQLGKGARWVAKPTDAFSPPLYTPSTYATPRSSEDSVRSCTSSVSLASSTSSFGQSRGDRSLPPLPLRIHSLSNLNPVAQAAGVTAVSSTGAESEDAYEQLALTPCLPPETSPQKGLGSGGDDYRSVEGRSSTTRTTQTHPNKGATSGAQSSLESRGAACLRDQHQDQGPMGNDAPEPEEDASANDTSQKRAFTAAFVRPPPTFPLDAKDEHKLVSLCVGGRVYTTSYSNITSKPSHLSTFIQDGIRTATVTPKRAAADLLHESDSHPRITVDSVSAKGDGTTVVAQLSSAKLANDVILQFPPSPISALRSSRASIFDDVPSDEGEGHEGDEDDLLLWAESGQARGRRVSRKGQEDSKLLSPDVRHQHRSSGSSIGASSSSSNGCLSFLDTTPDEEAFNPFHFQHLRVQAAPTSARQPCFPPSLPSSRPASVDRPSPVPASSQLPSLSSTPDSSAFEHCQSSSERSGISSPSSIYFSILSDCLSAKRPLDRVLAAQEVLHSGIHGAPHPVEVYLDRNPHPYDAILYYLREGILPRSLCYIGRTFTATDTDRFDAVLRATVENDDTTTSSSTTPGPSLPSSPLASLCIESMTASCKAALLPFLLSPLLAALQDLHQEAAYLGLEELERMCFEEMEAVQRVLREACESLVTHSATSRSAGSPPEREKGDLPTQYKKRLEVAGKNRARPKFLGHQRQFHSETSVASKNVSTMPDDDGWI